jgi:DNA polymerase I-like protein with 3'-5' exonuclease and polymerase domains
MSVTKTKNRNEEVTKNKTKEIEAVPRKLIVDHIGFDKFLGKIKREKEYACDTEFYTVNEYSGKVVLAGISFYLPKSNIAYYIPVNHTDVVTTLTWAQIRKGLAFMADREGPQRSLWHHFKADYKVLQQHGLDVWDHAFDTLLASKTLDENKIKHGLKDLTATLMSYEQIEFAELNAISNLLTKKNFVVHLTQKETYTDLQLRKLFDIKRSMTLREAYDKILKKVAAESFEYTAHVANLKKQIRLCKEFGDKPKREARLTQELKRMPKPLASRLWKHLTCKKATNSANICEMPIRFVLPYATDDVICTYLLKKKFAPKLEKIELLAHHTEEQVPLAKVLGRVELRGTPIDRRGVIVERERTVKLVAELEARISRLILKHFSKVYENAKVYEKTGRVINLNSTKQLGQLFYGDLGLTPLKRTPGGSPSTDSEALEPYKEENKLVRLYLEWKSETKILSTYLEMFLKRCVKHDDGLWYIHGEFVQYGAKTGRFSSKNPNLQNMPQGRRIRRFFYAPKKRKILQADYSQVELRILAYQSKDKQLVRAYCEPLPDGTFRDIHKVTASLIYHVDYHAVSAEQRKTGKTINFGIIYGMGASLLAAKIKVPLREAQGFIDKFNIGYSGVEKHLDNETKFVKVHGYTKTITGRRRRFPEIHYSRFMHNKKALYRMIRQGLNASIQGSSGDITGGAMVRVEYAFYDDPHFQMHVNVHDELLCSTAEEKAEKHAKKLVRLMQNPFGPNFNPIAPIPLLVEAKIGQTWAECKE